MITLGLSILGDYELWISSAGVIDYYDILLHQNENDVWYYKDAAGKEFLNLNLTDRNPLNNPVDKENLTVEELEFKQEYQTRQLRKDQGQPLIRLSKKHLEALTKLIEAKK